MSADDVTGLEDALGAGAGGDDEGFGGSIVYSISQLKRAREVLARLHGLRRSVRLYPAGHSAIDLAATQLLGVVREYYAEGVDVPITFFDGDIMLGEQALIDESLLFDQLARDLTALGIGSLTFLRGLDHAELVRAVPLLTAEAEEGTGSGWAAAAAAELGIEHLQVAPVAELEYSETAAQDQVRPPAEAYYGAIELMREIEHAVRTKQGLDGGSIRSAVRSLTDNVLNNRQAMLELSGLKDYDEYTFYHSVNVGVLAIALGSLITKKHRFLSSLGIGALLHDIGKMHVDLAVLNKPGPLSAEEWTLMRRHPMLGAEEAALTQGLDRASVVIILEHHMRQDLTGYPDRLTPRPIHLASRVVAVADAFDAMTSRRTYSPARLKDDAMVQLAQNAGTAFDPTLVRLFIDLMGIYPPRAVVRLSSGEVAVVLQRGEDPVKPVVRVIAAPDGELVQLPDLDLADEAAASGRSVVACLDHEDINVDLDDYL